MKKFIAALLLVVGLLVTTNVSAMSQKELMDLVSKEYTINGEKVKLDAGYVRDIRTFLNSYDLDEDDYDVMANAIKEAVAVVESNPKATKWSDLSSAQTEALSKIVADVTKATGTKASFDVKTGTLALKDASGVTVASIDPTKIQETDSNMTMIVVAGTISLIGLAVIVRKVVKA